MSDYKSAPGLCGKASKAMASNEISKEGYGWNQNQDI